jgi:hypothetical protein
MPRVPRGLLLCAALGLLAGPAAGCTRPAAGPKLVRVSGKVFYRDRPVQGALVAFVPNTAAPGVEAAQGYTGGDGAFTLTCPNRGPGAVPGEYKVTVSFPGGDTGKVPPQYGSLEKTPFQKVEVPEGGTDRLVLTLVD